jgi:hypothetical protein
MKALAAMVEGLKVRALETIPELAGLKMNEDTELTIEYDWKIRPAHAQALVDCGLLKLRQQLPRPWARVVKSLRPYKVKRPLSFDLWGKYYPDKQKIVIYDQSSSLIICALCYKMVSLCVPVPSIRILAHTHMISHAISHLGIDKNGKMWDGYADASQELKELFAQAYSYHFFLAYGKFLEAELMESFSEHQSEAYNQWQKYRNNLAGLNKKLMRVRNKEGMMSKEII